MPENNTQLIARLAIGVENITSNVELLREDIRSHSKQGTDLLIHMQSVDGDIKRLSGEVEHLLAIVRDGTSQPALISRVMHLESIQAVHQADIEEVKRRYDVYTSAKMVTKGQIITGIVGATITAVLALAAVVAAIFKS